MQTPPRQFPAALKPDWIKWRIYNLHITCKTSRTQQRDAHTQTREILIGFHTPAFCAFVLTRRNALGPNILDMACLFLAKKRYPTCSIGCKTGLEKIQAKKGKSARR